MWGSSLILYSTFSCQSEDTGWKHWEPPTLPELPSWAAFLEKLQAPCALPWPGCWGDV